MSPIADYSIIERIYESSHTLVYRARHQRDQQPVVLKILRETFPSPERRAWFQREYEMIRSLHLPGVIRAYGLETTPQRWIMVLEDFGGDSLAQLGLARQLPLASYLELAIHLAEIVGQIHQRHIMHKNINPTNIVAVPPWTSPDGEWWVKLIDFGIATDLLQEIPTFTRTALEGTLAYISPEQTGRMNRTVDYRTDLYSLGATLYELLCGQPPFLSDDPMALVHSHIAKTPLAPLEYHPDILPAVSEIILKLLAKNADDRYQSAHGLIADLRTCLWQWQTTGQVTPFPLGQYDTSDRFQLPQKLYGREAEMQTLRAAFERAGAAGTHWDEEPGDVGESRAEMILISGRPGVGKTALIREAYQPLTRQRGYFIAGKFDQLQGNVPYSALLQAFQSLVRQLLAESEAELAQWRERISAAVGLNGQVILEMIPDLALIIGSQPPVAELDPVQTRNRFNLVFQNFVRVFTHFGHPLVLFLDDLQWGDTASWELLRLLMTTSDHPNLLVIGTYQDSKVHQNHPLVLAVDEIRQGGGIVHHLSLSAWELPEITQFIQDAFRCSPERASPLAAVVQAKTGGNPFFVNEFLKSLYAQELVTFVLPTPTDAPERSADHSVPPSSSQTGWQWDLTQIQAQDITVNMVELLTDSVQQLKPETQAALKLAACIGDQFDLRTLATIYGKSPRETATDLWDGVVGGLIVPLEEAYQFMALDIPELPDPVTIECKFAHTRIRQATYSLIPEPDRRAVHTEIGRLLLQNTPPDRREDRIFDIVNHLNLGLTPPPDDSERYELAELNLFAGQKARRSAAHRPAFDYLKAGLELLDESDWEEQYSLTLALYVDAVYAAHSSGIPEQADELVEVVQRHARSVLDMVEVYDVMIQRDIAQHRMVEAIKLALRVLKSLGVVLPERPTETDISLGMEKVWSILDGKPIEDLADLPRMTDPQKLAAMRILSSMTPAAHSVVPELYSLISLERVLLSIQYGNAPASPAAYASFGLFLCSVVGDIDTGYQFGRLALRLVERLDATHFKARTWVTVHSFITYWKEHLRTTFAPLLEAHQSGLEAGDVSFGTGALISRCRNMYSAGWPLAELEREFASHSELIGQLGHKRNQMVVDLYRQVISNLLNRTEAPGYLSGEAYDEGEYLPLHLEANDNFLILHVRFNKLVLHYLFGEYENGLESAAAAEKHLSVGTGLILVPLFYFYDSLTRLAMYQDAPAAEREHILERARTNQEKMKHWADHAPMNFLHKFYLVEAEYARVTGKRGDAREYYDQAIRWARENQFVNEEALACELAASFYLNGGQTRLARHYLLDARSAYQRWGARAKVADLEMRYPELLIRTRTETLQVLPDSSITGRQAASILDFTSVVQALQTLSGEIVLEQLLRRLMVIVVQNAGAQRGMLILEEPEQAGRESPGWVIEAEAGIDGDGGQIAVLQSAPIATQSIPQSVINYVIHTHQRIVLHDATVEEQFTGDPYIVAQQPKSLLAMPLLYHGKLKGVLYLENNLITGAFTPDRLEVLHLLSTQAAISLENARLYDTLEQQVAARTAELVEARDAAETARQAAEDANRAKSVFLANMSHELRTPLNAILGFSELMTRDPNLTPDQRENLETINRSGEHLLALINDVLELSKIEAGRAEVQEESFDLYHMLLGLGEMFRLRTDEKHLTLVFDIAPTVPQHIHVDQNKLRQVLTNLLSNAVKFTEEGGITLRVTRISNEQPEITPNQQLADPTCRLAFEVEDTGVGIAPDELDKAFEAFVQTSSGQTSQQGTGLGLPISQEFVRMMGGELTASSEVGKGSRFRFDIQVEIVDASEIQAARPTRRAVGLEPGQSAPDGRPYRLLIVEDVEANRKLLTKLLRSLGLRVREAENGQEAVEVWKEWRPHLIWMDIRMPIMDGYEATRRIKALPQGQETIIVALTAGAFESERAAAISAGCDDFLRKPVSELDILDTLIRHLGVRFVYGETGEQVPEELALAEEQTTRTLADMPPGWLADLYQATLEGDLDWMQSLIEQIRIQYPVLANTLADLAYNFAHDEILNLIPPSSED